jgi:glycine/D-amino acid oxidase-like deaminating enzyme/nitrite reductase/ring-hydroxylating ferredoxin subunit
LKCCLLREDQEIGGFCGWQINTRLQTVKTDAGANVSLWAATTGDESLPLEHNTRADVCVVGAGITGLSVAYQLALRGRAVVVLDDGRIGGGETSHTTAHITAALDERYADLEKTHGQRGAAMAARSHVEAIDTIERIVMKEGIECEFERVSGYLCRVPGDSPDILKEEVGAAQRAGLAVEEVEAPPYDGYNFGAALHFPRQAQFHIIKYIEGLVRAIRSRGGRIHGGIRATEIRDGVSTRVITAAGEVRCGAVVVATHVPINVPIALPLKQAPYRTYVIAAPMPVGSMPRMLLWDTADPYHYVRTSHGAGHDWLMVGGEDHKTGQSDDYDGRFTALEAWARERFPMMEATRFRWSGQVMEPADGLGFIGRNPGDGNVYIATGDSGNGMTHGTIAGLLIADLMDGRPNQWAELYDPARKSVRSAARFARENLNVAAQFAAYVTPGDVGSSREIAPGSGAVVRHGLRKIAVYRDEGDGWHAHSAVCTHLGCVVAWNATEKTWDCPCHGSRFDKIDGHVINGPATGALETVDEPAESLSPADAEPPRGPDTTAGSQEADASRRTTGAWDRHLRRG